MSDLLFAAWGLHEDWSEVAEYPELYDAQSKIAYLLWDPEDELLRPDAPARFAEAVVEILNEHFDYNEMGFEFPALMVFTMEAVINAIPEDASDEYLNSVAWSLLEIYLRFSQL